MLFFYKSYNWKVFNYRKTNNRSDYDTSILYGFAQTNNLALPVLRCYLEHSSHSTVQSIKLGRKWPTRSEICTSLQWPLQYPCKTFLNAIAHEMVVHFVKNRTK